MRPAHVITLAWLMLARPDLIEAQETRDETVVCAFPRLPSWAERHQDHDGSWSPRYFDLNCQVEGRAACSGRGRGTFRVGATALMALGWLNAGSLNQDDASASAGHKAATFVLGHYGGSWPLHQRSPFSWESPDEAVNGAWTTILLARTAGFMESRNMSMIQGSGAHPRVWSLDDVRRAHRAATRRVRSGQSLMGCWSSESTASIRLDVTTWSLLALRAGLTKADTTDEEIERARKWIEFFAGRIESRGTAGDPARRIRARACRAVVRAATGADPATVAEDVSWLLVRLDADDPAIQDAEVLLFGTYAARKAGPAVADEWRTKVKRLLIDTQEKDGCASGSWSVTSIWAEDGGRVLSTALMTWALEVYYQYPWALWL